MAAADPARDDEVDRHQRQGPRQDRQGPARGPGKERVFVEGLNIIKRHQRPHAVAALTAPRPSAA